MDRVFLSILASLTLTSAAALADPAVQVRLVDGVARVQLEGSYVGSYYTVFRADAPGADFRAVTNDNVLCLGECYAQDEGAIPGHTYYYRFDLTPRPGTSVSYGPYRILIPPNPVRATFSPNPSRGLARVSLSLPGRVSDGPVQVEVRILDLQGRTVRVLQDGLLPRGSSTLTWDGRSDGGREVGAGLYFLRVLSPLGGSVARIVRIP